MPPANTTADCDRPPRRRRLPALASAAAVTALALLVAGCGGGGGSSPGVANVSNTHTTGSRSSNTTGGSALGGNSAPPPSSGGRGSGPQTGIAIDGGSRATALKLSECMRANGVPNFPDPNGQGVIQGTGFNPTSSSFEAAMNKCKRYTPHGGRAPTPQQTAQMQAEALRFSQCMRSHGLTNFPDPNFGPGGSVTIRIGAHNGTSLDPSSPIFHAAMRACRSNLPLKGKGLSTRSAGT
jgi:hypothetical protein